LPQPILHSETRQILPQQATLLHPPKLDQIINLLHSNPNSQLFHLQPTLIHQPLQIQSIKLYLPNHQQQPTTTLIPNPLPHSQLKSITPPHIIPSITYFFNLFNPI
ncbi:hypothetical protein, partial [Staphylococcus hominis]|uniref:hypothetical protein n=1 Tax=Staphylococcus hominis TaxID=1290 RepID=UPI001C92CB6B